MESNCQIHKSPIKYYCKQQGCKSPIQLSCGDCFAVGDHSGHKAMVIGQFNEQTAQIKKEIEQLLSLEEIRLEHTQTWGTIQKQLTQMIDLIDNNFKRSLQQVDLHLKLKKEALISLLNSGGSVSKDNKDAGGGGATKIDQELPNVDQMIKSSSGKEFLSKEIGIKLKLENYLQDQSQHLQRLFREFEGLNSNQAVIQNNELLIQRQPQDNYQIIVNNGSGVGIVNSNRDSAEKGNFKTASNSIQNGNSMSSSNYMGSSPSQLNQVNTTSPQKNTNGMDLNNNFNKNNSNLMNGGATISGQQPENGTEKKQQIQILIESFYNFQSKSISDINTPSMQVISDNQWCIKLLPYMSPAIVQHSIDNSQLFIGLDGTDGFLSCWEVNSGAVQKVYQTRYTHDPNATDNLQQIDLNLVATSSFDKTVQVYDIANDAVIAEITTAQKVVSLVVIDSDRLAFGGNDKVISVWQWRNHPSKINLPVNNSISNFNTNSSKVLSDSLYKKEDFQVRQLPGHNGIVLSIIMMNQHIMASGSSDSTIILWDVQEMKSIATLFGHENWVQCLIKINNVELVSGSYDDSIRIWNIEEQKCVQILKSHTSWVWSFLQIDNDHFISLSNDQSIKLWDAQEKSLIQTINNAHNSYPQGILIQNQRLVTTSSDKKLRVWQLRYNKL